MTYGRFHHLFSPLLIEFPKTLLISTTGVEPMKVMKVCGWRDLKTMARYVRLAGIDEKGVTDNLNFLPSEESISRNVVSLFGHRKK